MMIRKLLLALALIVCLPLTAFAACAGISVHGSGNHACFGRAAGNWATAGTWSDTSGGASNASVPAAGDEVILDANSGAGNYTMNANESLVAIDTTGFTGTWTHNSANTLT